MTHLETTYLIANFRQYANICKYLWKETLLIAFVLSIGEHLQSKMFRVRRLQKRFRLPSIWLGISTFHSIRI